MYRISATDFPRWISQRDVEHYTGTARGRPFEGVAIDPDDPPIYESHAYLERHGLFLPGERRRLTKEDFEPEEIAHE